MSTLRKLRKTLENIDDKPEHTAKPKITDYMAQSQERARLKSYTTLREQKIKQKRDYNTGKNYVYQKRDKRQFS